MGKDPWEDEEYNKEDEALADDMMHCGYIGYFYDNYKAYRAYELLFIRSCKDNKNYIGSNINNKKLNIRPMSIEIL